MFITDEVSGYGTPQKGKNGSANVIVKNDVTIPVPVQIIGGGGGGGSSLSDILLTDAANVLFVARDSGSAISYARVDTGAAYTPVAPIRVASALNPPYTITQTVVPIGTTPTLIVAANPARRSLEWMVVGTADVTVAPGTAGVAVGAGMIYQSGGTNRQGGSEAPQNGAPGNAFQGIAAAAGSNLIVWEGV